MLSNLINYIRYLPKTLKFTALAGVAAVLVAIPLITSAGYAPADRPVKDYNNINDRFGFDRPVFNSFINTPSYGDERPFYDVKDATQTAPGGFLDQVNVNGNGQEFLLRTYIHNGANPILNETGQGQARGTKVRILVPTATDRALRSISFVSADNTTPQLISDTADFVNESPFALEYVPGSARAGSAAVPGGYQVSDSIVTTGAPVGYNGPDGVIPGCFQFDVVVTIKVRVKAPDFSIKKQVRKHGDADKTFKESVTVKPGDKVDFQIEAKNTGTAEIRNLAIGDKLPAHMSYVPGTTKVATSRNPQGIAVNDNITTGGIDVGHYDPGANVFVLFTAQVTNNLEELPCGMTSLVNKAQAQPENLPPKEDTAEVKVPKECVQQEKEFKCIDLTASPTTGQPPLNVKFTATGQVSGGVTIEGYLFDFGDGTSQVFSTSNMVNHTYNNEGTFTASVLIKTSEGFTAPTDACKAVIRVSKVPVPPPPQPPQPPVTTVTVQPVSSVPTELVSTGPAETAAAGLLGSGGLGIAIRAFIRSRRGLLGALLDV